MFPENTKILIVDDSTFSRNIIKSGLKELKYWRLYEAESASAAQESIIAEEKNGEPIQLMIADIHMPEMTGLELLKWVRAREKSKSLPVIIVTTSQEREDVIRAATLGVSHFMVKPFDPVTLKERLGSVWERHGQHHQK